MSDKSFPGKISPLAGDIYRSNLVNVVVVPNPLDPVGSRQHTRVEFEGRTAAELLGPLQGDWFVMLNDKELELADLGSVTPQPGDFLTAIPVLHGGGGGESDGKTALRIIAVIILMVVTQGVAAGTIGNLGTYTIASVAAASAIAVVGTLAINALLPPPNPFENTEDDVASATYGIDGPKNTQVQGIAVPLVYGEAWVGGNVVSLYTRNHTDFRTQDLHMSIVLSEGPIEGVQEILINDQPAENFGITGARVLKGEINQEPIESYNGRGTLVIPESVGRRIRYNEWSVHQLTESADQIRIDILFDRGIGRYDGDGNFKSAVGRYEFEIREVGSDRWTGMLKQMFKTGTLEPGSGVLMGGEYRLDFGFDGDAGSIDLPGYDDEDWEFSSALVHSGKSSSPLRRSIYSARLDPTKQYEIRFRSLEPTEQSKYITDALVADINYLRLDKLRYPGTALLDLRVQLTDQLSSVPTVTSRVKGRILTVWDDSTGKWEQRWSDNPAWIVYDALTNKRYGAGMDPGRIKIEYFKEWARHCEANNLKFNGVLPQKSNIFDSLQPVLNAGRANLVRAGTRFQVSIERPEDPVMLFSAANIKAGSLSLNWMSLSERANEVHAKYYDIEDGGKQKTLVLQDPDAIEKGKDRRIAEYDMIGVISEDQARAQGTLALNMNKLRQTISFEAPISAIACTIGDVIAVQHEAPQWGVGGLTEKGSTPSRVLLDREIEMIGGNNYQLMINRDTVKKSETTVYSVSGNRALMTLDFNAEDVGRVTRLVEASSGKDYRIVELVVDRDSGRHGVVVDDATGLSEGHLVKLYETDAVEVLDVVTTEGKFRHVDLKSPVATPIDEETRFAFGVKGSVTKLFTVRGVQGRGDMYRQISCMEYSESVFSEKVIEGVPPVSPVPVAIANVTLNGIAEAPEYVAGIYKTKVQVSWSCNVYSYKNAEVYVREGEGAWELKGAARSNIEFEADPGDSLKIRIVPVDNSGKKPALGAVDEHVYTVVGVTPDAPESPTIAQTRVGHDYVELKWEPANNAREIHAYEVWTVANADTQGLDQAYKLATTTTSYYLHSGLSEGTKYKYWIREINPYYPNITSDWAPDESGLELTTETQDLLSEIFPEGIKDSHLSTELAEGIDKSELDRKVEEVALIAAQAITRNEVAVDESMRGDYDLDQRIRSLKAQYDDSLATVDETLKALASEDLALSQRITGLKSEHDDRLATIDESLTALANKDSAISQRIDTLKSGYDEQFASVDSSLSTLANADSAMSQRVDGLEVDLGEQFASVNSGLESLADADSATAKRIDDLDASFGEQLASINSSLIALSNIDSATSQRIDDLEASFGEQMASAESRLVALSNFDSAVSQRIDNLETSYDGQFASVNSSLSALSDSDVAISERIDTLEVNYGDQFASISGSLTALADADGSLASNIDTLATRVGDNESAIQTTQLSVDGLSAQYTVKIDNNGYVAGYGLASAPNDESGVTSEFAVKADIFKIEQTSGPEPIFAVDTRTGRNYLKEAVVGRIRSSNYSKRKTGFEIDAISGNAEFSSVYARGDIQASSLKANTVMVETLHIAGQAVTHPVSVTKEAKVYLGPYESTTYTANISATGAPILVFTSFDLTVEVGAGMFVIIRLKRGSTILRETTINLASGTLPIAWIYRDSPPSGTANYTMYVYLDDGDERISVSKFTLATLELKR